MAWWDQLVARHQARQTARFTITPEFGPVPYLPALPYTRQPVASQWEINAWMLVLLKSRYAPGEYQNPPAAASASLAPLAAG